MAKKRLNRASAKGFAKGIEEDLLSEIEVHYNQLIKETVTDLTFGVNGNAVSPVLTGFFASSWKASTSPVRQIDNPKNFSPWSKIKTRFDKETRTTVLAPGYSAKIKMRHYVPKKFRLNESAYIGNTARYTEWALVSRKSRLVEYILGAGGLSEKIDRIFTDKNRPGMKVKAEGGGVPYYDI